VLILASTVSFIFKYPDFNMPMCPMVFPKYLVSFTINVPVSLLIVPESPICPPDSP